MTTKTEKRRALRLRKMGCNLVLSPVMRKRARAFSLGIASVGGAAGAMKICEEKQEYDKKYPWLA